MSRRPLRRNVLAFGLIEAMVAAGLIAGSLGVMYAIWGPTSSASLVAGEVERLEKLRHSVPGEYASAPNFDGITTDPMLHALSGASPWGAFALEPATLKSASDGWQASYASVPTDACERLVNAEWGRDWTSIQVDGQTIQGAAQGVTQCQTSATHAMTFSMWGGARGMNGIGVLLPPGSGPVRNPPPGVGMPPVPTPNPGPPAPPPSPPPHGGPTPSPGPGGGPAPAPPPVYPPVGTPVYPPGCVPPAPQQQPVACPAGQIQSVPPYGTNGVTDQRDATCPWAYANPVWGPWYAVSNTCAPKCSAPPSGTGTQTASCPSGQVTSSGASTFGQSRTITYTCPAPTGAYTTIDGSWSPAVSSVCAPQCVAPAPTTGSQTVSCPAGQVTSSGASSFTQTRSVTYACPALQGSYTTAYGAWSPAVSSVCAPKCSAPPTGTSTSTRWLTTSPGCPAGQSGTYSYQYQQSQTTTTTWSCPAPTGSATSSSSTSPWANTGATQNVTNTCAPSVKYAACAVVSPNGPDVESVLYDLSTKHIVEAVFDASITLTPAQQAETQMGGGFCPDNVLIYYGGYASANALAAGMHSSDYMTEWPQYPDPSFPSGPVW